MENDARVTVRRASRLKLLVAVGDVLAEAMLQRSMRLLVSRRLVQCIARHLGRSISLLRHALKFVDRLRAIPVRGDLQVRQARLKQAAGTGEVQAWPHQQVTGLAVGCDFKGR